MKAARVFAPPTSRREDRCSFTPDLFNRQPETPSCHQTPTTFIVIDTNDLQTVPKLRLADSLISSTAIVESVESPVEQGHVLQIRETVFQDCRTMFTNNWHLTVLVCLLSCRQSATTPGYCNGHKMIQSGGLTCEDRQLILREHNKLRQSVALGRVSGQPSATNMRELVWDDRLAAIAQSLTDKCIIAHDFSKKDGRFPLGQNLAATWTSRSSVSPAPDFSRQISDWFNEVSLFHYGSTGLTDGTGHYSQLVWGDTYLVGCGYSFYYDKSRGYTKLYICNYGPGGNVIGEEPYVKGPPSCILYGMSSSSRYQGLCGTQGYSDLGSRCSNTINQAFNKDTTNLKFNSAFHFYYGR